MKYGYDVRFDGGKYFSGALDLDWFLNDQTKACLASESYIFHGKKYLLGNVCNGNNIGQNQILTDSVTMIEELLDSFNNQNNHSVLTIAGYGAGKTHFALAISMLLSAVGNNREKILNEIRKVDSAATNRIESILNIDDRPYFILPINGMRNTNLKDLFFDSASHSLDLYNCNKDCLIPFDPRFDYLRQTIQNMDATKRMSLFRQLGIIDESHFMQLINKHDDDFYKLTSNTLKDMGINIFQISPKGELKDLIYTLATSLCGKGKPFRGMLIVFDEFGKYLSFSASQEAIAGAGCMQQLYEGVYSIQSDSPIVLWGLTQLELRAYQASLIDQAAINNMQRYVSRFNIAKKYYLSICFESLIANLIYKRNIPDYVKSTQEASKSIKLITKYFSSAKNYPVWTETDKFSEVVRMGCWPLSAYAVWTLTYITSINNILQQRSGFNVLMSLFSSLKGQDVPEGTNTKFPIRAVDLYDAGLGEEFEIAEFVSKSASQIANECKAVIIKYGQQMNEKEKKVLHAIVLLNKLSAFCSSEDDTKSLLASISGIKAADVDASINNLRLSFNCVYFNTGSKLFEIQSNAATGSQFKQFVFDKVENEKSKYAQKALFDFAQDILIKSEDLRELRECFFENVECDFAFKNEIFSKEWNYESRIIISYDNYLSKTRGELDNLIYNPPNSIFELKGRMLYYLIPSNAEPKTVINEIKGVFVDYSQKMGHILPAMGLILHDRDNLVRDNLLEIKILSELNAAERKKYDALIYPRIANIQSDLLNILNDMKQKRYLVYPIDSKRPRFLTGAQIFKEIYPKTIPFNLDGIQNGMGTVSKFIEVLSTDGISWNDFTSLNTQHVNRAKILLDRAWGIFDKNGSILKYPKSDNIASYFKEIDSKLELQSKINLIDLYKGLLEAPFGCNTSQATLLTLVYIAGRSNTIEFKQNDIQVYLANLVKQKMAFDSKSYAFKENSWKDIIINKSIKDDSKWYDLYDMWNKETSFTEIMKCMERCNNLLEENISIPGVISKEILELSEKAKSIKSINNKWVEESKPYIQYIQSNLNGPNIFDIVEQLCRLNKLYNETIGKSKSYIKADQKVSYDAIVKATKNHIKNNLYRWFVTNSLPPNTHDISDISDTYTILTKRLINLGMDNEAKVVDEKKAEITDGYKKLKAFNIKRKQLETEYESLYGSVKNSGKSESLACTCNTRIFAQIEEIDEYINKGNAIPLGETLNDIRAKYIGLKNIVENNIRVNQTYVMSLGTIKVENFDELEQIEKEIDRTYSFYENSTISTNRDILNSAKAEIRYFKILFHELKQSADSYEKIDEIINSYRFKLSNLDSTPIQYEPILKAFKDNAISDLIAMSEKWKDSIVAKFGRCSKMEDYLSLSSEIASYPECLTDDDLAEVKKVKENINQQISSLTMEYIIELYNKLRVPEQKEILNRLQKIVGAWL